MVARHLITTAIHQTWKMDRPVIFLGEWCKLNLKQDEIVELDQLTVTYHWDDRQQFYKDYLYLSRLHEKLLHACANALNNFHGVDHSIRYWRILIGPWLGCFTQILFDRWKMINNAASAFDISSYTALDVSDERMTPYDMSEFGELFIDDVWNLWVYGKILVYQTDIEYDSIPIDQTALNYFNRSPVNNKGKLKKIIKCMLNGLSSFTGKWNNYFFINANIPYFRRVLLELKLGQLPSFFYSPSVTIKTVYNEEQRAKFFVDIKTNDRFELFLVSMLVKQIPVSFLEDYVSLIAHTKQVSWPIQPKVIFTSHAAPTNGIFEAWVADKVESGSKLVVGQHGGLYGAAKWFFPESHERMICDYYFSWGWNDEQMSNIIRLPASKFLSNKYKSLRYNPTGSILQVIGCWPRYSYYMGAIPTYSQQVHHYNKEQIKFAMALDESAKKHLLVRLSPDCYGRDQKYYWNERINKVNFDNNHSIYESIKQSRLFVGTYNGTTFLETFVANVPTVIFFNPKHFELRELAQPYYDKLREVGILHDTADSAARHVSNISGNIESWWRRPDIQQVRFDFCCQFAKTSSDPLDQWKNILLNLHS